MFHTLLLSAAIGLTVGLLAGSVGAAAKTRRHDYTKPGVQRAARFNTALFRIAKKAAYVIIGVGIVWTLYFLVLGLTDHGQTEFATNASTLIVSVVTLFSILIAYHEFMQRGQGGKEDASANDKAVLAPPESEPPGPV